MRRAAKFVVLFCVLGCFWVWKESWNERLTTRVMELDRQAVELRTNMGYLRRELLGVCEYARIEGAARRQLGMVLPASSPDTIWSRHCESQVSLGAMSLCRLDLKGVTR
jgi:cell division protein FtsL